MGSVRRRFGPVLFALVLGSAVFAASTSASSMTVRFKGPFTLAEYIQLDPTGCVVTDVVSTAASGRQSVNGEGTSSFEEVDAFVSVFDTCGGGQDTILVCTSFPTTSADMSVDRQLTTGTASGVMTCTDLDTGATCQLAKSEALNGVGEVRSGRDHFHDRQGNVMVNALFRGRFRDAEVTAASLSGCGLSLTQDDAVYAELESTSSIFVQVEHP